MNNRLAHSAGADRPAGRPRKSRRGFTLIELVVTVFLAASGIMAMVGMSAIQNQLFRFERDMTVARMLGEGFLAKTRGEAANWGASGIQPDDDASATPLLSRAMWGPGTVLGGGESWMAVPSADRASSPTFNGMGVPSMDLVGGVGIDPLNTEVNGYNQRYCIHYRAERVAEGIAPDRLLNIQVRVFWPVRDNAYTTANGAFADCGFLTGDGALDDGIGMDDQQDLFRYVQLTTVVHQHAAF